MRTMAITSYERKIVAALMLLLVIFGYVVFHALHEQKTYDVYVKSGRMVLTGQSTQMYTETVIYEASSMQVYDDTMYEDECVVVQEAENGVKEITRLTAYYNGDKLNSRILDETIIKEAVPEVVHIGTMTRPKYICPVSGYTISSCYGARWGRQHEGVDLAVDVGQTVMATADGTVVRAEYYSGYGYCVDIDHGNGVLSRYGHLSRIDVSVGQAVSQGEYIALSGNTGNSTGPHLHFELRINNSAVNPCDYMDL